MFLFVTGYTNLGFSCIYTIFFFSAVAFRSSLGEYHKDSRNLKRIKDSSEFSLAFNMLLCLCEVFILDA